MDLSRVVCFAVPTSKPSSTWVSGRCRSRSAWTHSGTPNNWYTCGRGQGRRGGRLKNGVTCALALHLRSSTAAIRGRRGRVPAPFLAHTHPPGPACGTLGHRTCRWLGRASPSTCLPPRAGSGPTWTHQIQQGLLQGQGKLGNMQAHSILYPHNSKTPSNIQQGPSLRSIATWAACCQGRRQ